MKSHNTQGLVLDENLKNLLESKEQECSGELIVSYVGKQIDHHYMGTVLCLAEQDNDKIAITYIVYDYKTHVYSSRFAGVVPSEKFALMLMDKVIGCNTTEQLKKAESEVGEEIKRFINNGKR